MKGLFLLCVSLFASLAASTRGSSAPFISGDGFRAHCDFLFDETDKSFDPEKVRDGDVVFVKTDYLEEYFQEKHPKIHAKYIIVSHNSDHPAPRSFGHVLDEGKVIAWFAQNVENYSHPRLHPIPIGLANRCWSHGNPDLYAQMQKNAERSKRPHLLYMNFAIGTCLEERQYVWNLFASAPYCVSSESKPILGYLKDLTHCCFSLSPKGNGIDCHRTWEILYMHAIPVVKSSSINALYEELPILVVDDWTQINEAFLRRKYEEITSKKGYNLYKLNLQYWLDWIDSYKAKAKE